MATLVLTAAGTAIAGPIGASIGSLIGSQIDAALFGPPDREGPRLEELKVTTSSYGTPIARHFGTMRAAGSVIWAADLREASEESGGKGQPSVTTYTYSASFAVALASRKITDIRRVWADGNLLRGAAGDLKTGGAMRIYHGTGDQQPDPLIASAEGNSAPAFRGLAYCVFEDLQLADFGNRIPSLTFEVVADTGDVSLVALLQPVTGAVEVDRPLNALQGFSDQGGAIRETLASIDRVFPLASNSGDSALLITSAHSDEEPTFVLPPAIIDRSGDGFGGAQGRSEKATADESRIPVGLRYYDVDRDYQAGMQRAGGRALPGAKRLIEFPGALQATNARRLADDAAERARWSQERLAYRIAEIDTAIAPGRTVTVPGRAGKWRIEAWEWRDTGVELELLRLPLRSGSASETEAGRSLVQPDLVSTPSLLEAYELPWDGAGSPDQRQVFAAASSASAGWRGAAVYAVSESALRLIGNTGSRRAIIGQTNSVLPSASTTIIDRHSSLDVTLASADFVLESCALEDLGSGVNRALVGDEIVQFAGAEHIGGNSWRLSTLLRGRGGTEHVAHAETPSGASFVLLDERPVELDTAQLGMSETIALIGLADADPVKDTIATTGRSLQPLSPVHAIANHNADGSLTVCWIRRARGSWTWNGTVEIPLVEQSERYEVGLGDPESPTLTWEVDKPSLDIDAALFGELQNSHSGDPIWVRQIGTYARSAATLITNIS